jgi:hypothetical protein
MNGNQTETCNKCKKDLPLVEFYRAPKGLYGRRGKCKKCLGHPSTEELEAEKKRKHRNL